LGCKSSATSGQKLAEKIGSNNYFDFTKMKALEIVKTGFNAGDGYGEVWIRDYNTFIELSAGVLYKAIQLFEELAQNN